jgi:X-X-X-Leu-X-X-Gly heptad repeat protein
MNKTLLLILCDFLLLTLLALTRWETAEPPVPRQPPVPEMAANAVTKEQDLVAAMRQSLTDEKAARDELAQKLSTTETALSTREQSLTQAQAERARLAQEKNAVAATLGETQKTAAQLSEKLTAATQESTMTREQLAQLQRELAEKQAEADRLEKARAALEKQHADARKQIEGLTLAVVVAEQEKKNLRETADSLKGQVEAERTERAKVVEANTQLSSGLGQLAEKSGQLSKEIRENRPINANVLFNDYLTNRVHASFNATRKGLLGSVTKAKEGDTVLVTDGARVYALMHVADTVLAFGEYGIEWESLSVDLAHGSSRLSANRVDFLAQDPRIVVMPLDPAQAASLGARIYPLAADPFKFPEAVLIDGGGRGYGEVGFKLDASQPGFVQVDNRFFKRLFGDFRPKQGDLVLAKTGELLGIMVNNDYCALLKDFAVAKSIQPGKDIKAQQTAAVFDQLIARMRSLPLKLQ